MEDKYVIEEYYNNFGNYYDVPLISYLNARKNYDKRTVNLVVTLFRELGPGLQRYVTFYQLAINQEHFTFKKIKKRLEEYNKFYYLLDKKKINFEQFLNYRNNFEVTDIVYKDMVTFTKSYYWGYKDKCD